MTGLRGRASIAGGALIIAAGLALFPVATATLRAAAATTPTQGVDVSSLQHPTTTSTIDWAQVAAAGNAFTAVKASEGNYYTNPWFAGDATHPQSDVKDATAQSLYVIPYAFANPFDSTPTGNGTAVQQADRAAGVITSANAPANLMLPLALDMEPDPYAATEGTNQCYGLSPTAMVAWINAFITEANAKLNLNASRPLIIYTTAGWWNTCTGSSTAFSSHPLWLASYGVSNPALPAGWNNYTFWQYTDNGTVSGISGPSDLDYLGPVLQVSPAGKPIAPVQLHTLTSVNGQSVSYPTVTGLPPGLAMSSSGQITGTPAAADAGHQYSVTVTPSAGSVPATLNFNWHVAGPIAVHSPGSPTTTAGTPLVLRITASDPDTGYTPSFTASGLPSGLTMSSGGVVTGWPWKPGSFTVTVAASDAFGGTGTTSFTWTIKAAGNSGTTGIIREVGGSGKCLNDPAGATANGTLPNMWTCDGKSFQKWTVVQDGTIRVAGKCLDMAGTGSATTTAVRLWTCNSGDPAQQWQAGSYGQLVNPSSAKCLFISGSSAANGSKPVVQACANATGYHWNRPAAPVFSAEPGRCLAASGTAAGSAVELVTCANVATQHWVAASDGSFKLSTSCLTENGKTAGSLLSIASCSGASSTKWTVVSAGQIATELKSAESSLCVSVPSTSTASGTRLVIGPCAATPAATWHVE